MAERRQNRRWRPTLAWGLSVALVAAYLLVGGDDDEGGAIPPAASPTPATTDGKLEILEIAPGEPTPGSAVEIHFLGADPSNRAPVRAFLSGKEEAPVIQQRGDRLTIRIPKTVKPGRNKIRVQQGADDDKRSKPYDLRIKPLDRRKQLRTVIGGLALLVFGLRTMSGGSRSYTGQRSRSFLTRIGRRTPAAVALGVLVGGITQFTTTAAGLVVGLVESHLLAVIPGVAVLLGAQLGAAVAPSAMVLASTREGLLVVGIGVIWLTLAIDRRSESLGKIVLGCGLLFYGLYMLRDGLQPLVTDPEMVPYLDHLRADNVLGLMACAALGVVLALALQGPAPVYVLVLSVAQASGRIDVQGALAILAGTGLGAALATIVVAWPFGVDARRMARTHIALALVGTVFLAATVGLWATAANTLLPVQPKVPSNIGTHLFAAFALSQLAVTVLLAALLPPTTKLLQSLAPRRAVTIPPALSGQTGIDALRAGLARVLQNHRTALVGIRDLCLTGHRDSGRRSEHTLADTRGEIEALFAGAIRTKSEEAGLAKLRQAAVSVVQLQRSLEDLLRHVDRGTEKRMALVPAGEAWQMPERDEATVKALHDLLLEGILALVRFLETGDAPDIEEARSREIRLNAMESEARHALLKEGPDGQNGDAIAYRLGATDLVNAYESVGNHVYRLSEALAADIDQDD